jgi:PAS domain S-box-containing protein
MDPRTIKVLLLDDDPNLRTVLSDILKMKGIESIPVDTGAAALARIEQQDIDVALIDLKLEDISGLEVLSAIKARSPETECIMLTGHASQATAIDAINLGAYSYFQKPYEVDQLLVAIQRATEKHAAMHALQEREIRYRSLFEQTHDAIYILDLEGRHLDANPRAAELLGYTRDEILRLSFTDISSQLQESQQVFRRLLMGEHIPLYQRIFRKKNGGLMPVEINAELVRDENGQPLHILSVVRDITERKRAEAERQALLEIMQGLAATKNLPEFLQLIHHSIAKVIYAENFFVVFHNKRSGLFEEVYAVDQYDAPMPSSILGKSITSYVFRTGEPLLLTQERFEELAARGEVELVGTNSPSWLGAPLKTPSETIGVIVVQNYEDADCYSERDREFLASVGVQVSLAIERKQAEDALRSSESSIQAVLQSTADGILAVGRENEVLYSNQPFAEMWRIPQAVIASQDDSVLLQHVLDQLSDPQGFLKKVQELYKSEEESFDTLHFKDGRVFERLSRPLLLGTELLGRVWSFRDVTERKRAEAEILRMVERWSIVYRAGEEIGASLEPEQVFAAVHRAVEQVMPCEDFVISLYDENRNEMQGNYNSENKKRVAPNPYPADHGLGGFIVHSGQSLILNSPEQIKSSGIKFEPYGSGPITASVVAVPLQVKGKTIGILSAQSYHSDAYTTADQELLEMLASHAAVAIDNARLFEQAQQEVLVRQQAEERIAVSEAELRALFASMHDVVLVIDRLGVYLKIAPTNPDLLVKPPQELLGKTLRDVFRPEQAETFISVVKQVLDTKQTSHIEYDLIIGDRTVWFETSISPMTEDSTLWVARDINERRQAEVALRQAEARYRSVVEQVPAVFYTEYLDDRAIFVSSKIETVLGYTPEEWMSEPGFWRRSVHPDDLERVQAEDERTDQSGEAFQIDYRVIRKDGRVVWLRDQALLVKDEGKPVFWQGVMYDISAEKESESALRASEERYRMLAENTTDTVWLMDMSLRTTYISPSVTRLRGFTLDEINAIPFDQQMPPDSLQRALQMLAETLSPENLAQPDRLISRTIELEFFKKDGTKFWSENTFTLIRDPQGQPFAILGSGRDISERVNAQAALQNSEKYFRALIENNTDAIVLVDPGGMILYESPQNSTMLGRAIGQRLGRSGYEYIHPEDRNSVMQTIHELVQHPGAIRYLIFRNQHKDGSWRWIEATVTNLLGESAINGLIINMHDITDRKQAEEEIRRRVADLEVLYENGLSINALLEPGKIAQKMIEVLSQKLDWHHGSIRLVHPETKQIEFLALNKPGLTPDQTRVEMNRLKKVFTSTNQGLSGWVIKHGKTIRSGDVLADKRYVKAFPEIRSGLYVPLMIGERAIGSIAVESRQANRFSEEDERLLKTLAAQSAIAFENARLYQESVSAAKRKAALHQGGLEIVRAGQDIEALCMAVHQAAQQVMPAEAFTVSLLTEDGREVEAPYLYDRGIRHPNTRLPAGAGITGRVINSKKPLLLKDVQKSRGVKPIMVDGSEPTRSVLSVPLLAQDRIIGVISAQSHEADVYSVEDQVFLETLASEAAVAFENARLFQEIRHRLTELESLSQVSDSLTSAIDLQPLLVNILEGARNAIPAAEKGAILLAEPDGGLRLHAMSGYTDPRLIGLVLPDENGYAVRVAREQTPLKIDDAQTEYGIPYKGMIEEIDTIQSGIAAPMIVKGRVIGVISLDNASRKAAFIGSDLRLLVTFASSAAVAIENARLFTETQQRLHRLTALHSIDAAIGASVDINVTLRIVLEHVMMELKADAAAVLLFNPLTRMLEYAAGRGFRFHVIEGLRLRLGEGLAGQSVLQRRAINIADLRQANQVEQVMEHPVSGSALVPLQYLEEEGFVSYHAIPLIAKGQIQGVLEIFQRTPMQVDQEWITFFEMLAGQTAIAIDNGRLFENLQQSNLELTLAYDATIQGWSQALELRDEETEGHTRRVTDLTLRLIQAMGLEEVETEHARRGALLHDIGKIAIPDSILLKPGPLDEHEWSLMRQHPQYAYNMLFPITYLAPAIHIPWCHHEKWDGSGYPRGLKGEQIPMVARIFAIADVYDALITNRPYRLAWRREKALEYIREQSGKHFDPKVVKAFMDLMAGEK